MHTKLGNILRNCVSFKKKLVCLSKSWSSYNYENSIDVSPEISEALRSHKPVVALESAIISHGMPYPQNLQVALQVEEVIRNQVGLRSCYKVTVENSIDVSPEISEALRSHKPVVALESAIISHGMPYPQNLQVAMQVEEVIRNQGAVPATIAIVEGRIKVGLDEETFTEFASLKKACIKTSRRDFPYVLSKGLNGGTTVSGTTIVASTVGIKVFATGGLGGVHRGGEITMDVSADLTELGRTSIAVVSSGVKSILDIEKTLEYLETQGVCVITYGHTTDFPSFYTPRSGVKSPYNVETPTEAAMLIHKLFQLRLSSGLLLAVPIPEGEAMEGTEIENAICTAVKEAEDSGIKGKEITPFILKQVTELTAGKSLESNIALIKNNAKVAAQVAMELEKISSSSSKFYFPIYVAALQRKYCEGLLGASILDFGHIFVFFNHAVINMSSTATYINTCQRQANTEPHLMYSNNGIQLNNTYRDVGAFSAANSVGAVNHFVNTIPSTATKNNTEPPSSKTGNTESHLIYSNNGIQLNNTYSNVGAFSAVNSVGYMNHSVAAFSAANSV